MLGWRLLVSAILIPGFVLLFRLDDYAGPTAPVLFTLMCLLSARCAWELSELLTTRSMQPGRWFGMTFALMAVSAGWLHRLDLPFEQPYGLITSLAGVGAVVCFAVIAAFARGMIRYRRPGNSMETLGADLLVVGYAGLLPAITIQMRWFPSASLGYYVLASMIIAAKSGDTMAYTFGRLFGKRKMVPTLSPGKTWAGGVGAIVGSGLGGWLWLKYGIGLFDTSRQPGPDVWLVTYSVLIGVVGLVGDLAESLIKRDVGSKDSAAIMPGFGGLLDLLDSLVYAGPIALLLWHLLPMLK